MSSRRGMQASRPVCTTSLLALCPFSIRLVHLARTLHQTIEAALLLSRIECDLGHHRAELDQAWLLMRLAPHSVESLGVMQRAAGHNGLKPLVEQASAAIAALEEARKGRKFVVPVRQDTEAAEASFT
jgi:hypothetical protein